MRADRPLLPHVVRKDLTPALGKVSVSSLYGTQANNSLPARLNPLIAEEVDLAFREELPPCKDFTLVPIYKKLLRIVAKVSGRVFIGPEVCRSEEYIDMAINFTLELNRAQGVLNSMKPWQRTLFANSKPHVKALQERQRKSREFLKPLIAARKKVAESGTEYQKPDDALQWLLDNGQATFGQQKESDITEIQLSLTFAAIHTTTMTATNAYVAGFFS